MDFKKILKITTPILIICFVIIVGGLLIPILAPPKSGSSEEEKVVKEENKVDISIELEHEDLKRRLKTQEKNSDILFKNQKKIVESIKEILEDNKNSNQNEADNRKYIIAIYKELLSVEDQIQNAGGGYNLKTKIKQEEINPLIGTQRLPAAVAPETTGPTETKQ